MAARRLQVIRQSSFKATPWKNGGGVTHEAWRIPAAGDPFRWRVSVAHIDASGPFSDFSAYQRIMVLLRGAGIELRFADGRRTTLRRVGELAQFDGAISTYGELLNGPCVDLNLMVSKSDRVDARMVLLGEPVAVGAVATRGGEGAGAPLSTAPASTAAGASGSGPTLIVCIEGSGLLECDTGEAATLHPWDLAILTGGGARLSRLGSGGESAPVLAFTATVAAPGEGAVPDEVC